MFRKRILPALCHFISHRPYYYNSATSNMAHLTADKNVVVDGSGTSRARHTRSRVSKYFTNDSHNKDTTPAEKLIKGLKRSNQNLKLKAEKSEKTQNKQEKSDEYDVSGSSAAKKNNKAKKSKRVSIEYESRSIDDGIKRPKWEPVCWKEQYENIKEMRKCKDAPVDTMGCDTLGDRQASKQDFHYQILLSLMLSSQTKDEVTAAAMNRLKQHGCSVKNILQTPDEKLGQLIYPVGFWKKKISYIKRTSEVLQDKYDSDIPNTLDGLCQLPGVGPKMAHLVMRSAWGEVTGIGVDTHVHRISNRLGWVKTKQPEQTRVALEDWLPREYWNEINALLVGFGQQTCLPVKPKCRNCLNKTICPAGKSNLRSKNLKDVL